jgi:hypothetical protein
MPESDIPLSCRVYSLSELLQNGEQAAQRGNPKFQISNPKPIRNSKLKIQNEPAVQRQRFGHWDFGF